MNLKSFLASMVFLLTANFAVAAVTVTCANPNQSPAYNVGSTSANNVPIGQCYLNTVGECLYNTANPATASGGWNTGCPSSVAGSDCCRWKKPVAQSGDCCKAKPNANPTYDCSMPLLNFGHPQGVSFARERCVQVNAGASCEWSTSNIKCCVPGLPGCGSPEVACNPPSVSIAYPFTQLATNPAAAELYARCKAAAGASGNPQAYKCCVTIPSGPACNPPSVSVAYPFTQLATNPAYADLYAKCKAAAGASGNPQAYKCCVDVPKDPCEAKGLFNVKGEALNLQGQGILCCTSKNPKEEMLSGKKVCCEVIKPSQSK
jgi:hypothetical protein